MKPNKMDSNWQNHPSIWVFPKIVVPQNGWFIRENPIKIHDLGVPLFLETPIFNGGETEKPGFQIQQLILYEIASTYFLEVWQFAHWK